MPKMKTRKSIAKRVKRTASGGYKFTKPGRRHLAILVIAISDKCFHVCFCQPF